MPQWLSTTFESWHQGKVFLERLTSVSHDALHILAGTVVWVLLALVLRRPLTSWVPLAGTLLLAGINEMVDLSVEVWPDLWMQAGEAAKDMVTTNALPLFLLLVLRMSPRLAGPGARRSPPRRRAS